MPVPRTGKSGSITVDAATVENTQNWEYNESNDAQEYVDAGMIKTTDGNDSANLTFELLGIKSTSLVTNGDTFAFVGIDNTGSAITVSEARVTSIRVGTDIRGAAHTGCTVTATCHSLAT